MFGWAFDFNGVQRIEVDVDGQVVGNATFGLLAAGRAPNDPRAPSNTLGFSFRARHDAAVGLGARPRHLRRGQPFGAPGRTEIGRRKFVVNNNVLTHK